MTFSRVVTQHMPKASVIFALALGMALLSPLTSQRSSAAHKRVSFAAKTIKGKKISSKSLQGKVYLIDFWASWCGPCKKALPFYQKLQKEYASKGFEVITVSVDRKRDNVDEFIEDENLKLPVIHDIKHELAEIFRPKKMPSSYLVDGKGNLIKEFSGFSSGHKKPIRDAINSALKK